MSLLQSYGSVVRFSLKDVAFLVGCGSAAWLLKQLYNFHKLTKGVSYIPGTWNLMHGPILPRFLPIIRGFNRDYMWPWKNKHSGEKQSRAYSTALHCEGY
jgi:hypothetical protein